MDTDELSESGRVVIPHSLGVTPGLEHGVGLTSRRVNIVYIPNQAPPHLDDLVLQPGLALLPLAGGADGGEVGDDLLGVLCLPGARLSSEIREMKVF